MLKCFVLKFSVLIQVRVGPQPVVVTPSNMQRFGPVLSPIPISMGSDPSFIYGNIIAGKQNWLNDIAQVILQSFDYCDGIYESSSWVGSFS